MAKLGIPYEFVKMIGILFVGANVSIIINGKPSKEFPIEKGVQ
jgi:hypothetical protein